MAAAVDDLDIRYSALYYGLITVEQVLQMPGSLLPLLQDQPGRFFGFRWGSHLLGRFYELAHGSNGSTEAAPPSVAMRDLAAAGRYFSNNPGLPWIVGKTDGLRGYEWRTQVSHDVKRSDLDPVTYLGGAGVALMAAEADGSRPADVLANDPSLLGPFSDLYAYMEHRHGEVSWPLPELPMPDEFKEVFRDWAECKVNFTAQA
jgi:hypothetical protein